MVYFGVVGFSKRKSRSCYPTNKGLPNVNYFSSPWSSCSCFLLVFFFHLNIALGRSIVFLSILKQDLMQRKELVFVRKRWKAFFFSSMMMPFIIRMKVITWINYEMLTTGFLLGYLLSAISCLQYNCTHNQPNGSSLYLYREWYDDVNSTFSACSWDHSALGR